MAQGFLLWVESKMVCATTTTTNNNNNNNLRRFTVTQTPVKKTSTNAGVKTSNKLRLFANT